MSETRLEMGQRRRARLLLFTGVVVLMTGLGVWYVNNPRSLPTSDAMVNASTVTGRPVYVGVFVARNDFDRTLHLSGVMVHTTANTQVDVVPYLCRDGSVSATTDPEPFCGELVNPEGQRFGTGDSIVLKVSADESAIAVIDRVELGFREGLQWGTLPAGSSAVVSIQAR